QVRNRRFKRLHMHRERTVGQKPTSPETCDTLRLHDEGADCTVRRDGRYVVRNIRTRPTLTVPVHVLLGFAPRLAVGVGRSTVVLNAAVGRPREAPVRVDTQTRRVGVVAPLSHVAGRTIEAGVDPHTAVSGAVVPHFSKRGETLPRFA